MSVALRPFQAELERKVYEAWNAGAQNVMPVAATGSGKTVILSKMLLDEPGHSAAIAHRQELVSQIVFIAYIFYNWKKCGWKIIVF